MRDAWGQYHQPTLHKKQSKEGAGERKQIQKQKQHC